MPIADYDATSGDWRAQIKRNECRTRWVIFTYLFIFVAVGLIVDAYILQAQHPGMALSQAFSLLIAFKVVPIATLILGGVAGASLFITFHMHDRIMLLGTHSREITSENATSIEEKQLYNVVDEMKVAAGMQYMPKVYLIDANYMNAFASGYSEKSAMVAITHGLLKKLSRSELQAVMAHELSHIRHHDIKLNLTVAVLSNILLIVIDVLFYNILFGRDRRGDNRIVMVIVILRFVLPILTMALALFLNRTREYMADAGAVELMRDNEPLARALLKISHDHEMHAEEYAKEYGVTAHEQVRQASYLFDPSRIDPVKSFHNMFSTHPQIEQRLQAIGFRKEKAKDK